MGLDALLDRMESRSAETPETADVVRAVTREPTLILVRTPATYATAEKASTEKTLFAFAPPSDPESDREALEERAAIIAEGCGMDPVQALQEARWQVERERAWRVFLHNARRILEASEAARAGLLDRYQAEATSRFGDVMAKTMVQTMCGWVAARVRERKPSHATRLG